MTIVFHDDMGIYAAAMRRNRPGVHLLAVDRCFPLGARDDAFAYAAWRLTRMRGRAPRPGEAAEVVMACPDVSCDRHLDPDNGLVGDLYTRSA